MSMQFPAVAGTRVFGLEVQTEMEKGHATGRHVVSDAPAAVPGSSTASLCVRAGV